jgi:hypothetical protein
MRFKSLLVTTILLLLIAGCSGKMSETISPVMHDDNPESASEVVILAKGTMDLSKGTALFDNRILDPYYDVTGYIGSNFTYVINGIIPPDILDITLAIDNVSGITVHDVCIVFEELYGKKVMNPDCYIDIFQPWDIDPFIAFGKDNYFREFPPGKETEQLLLKYPSGASPLIKYFIIAHIGGNTGGVYDFSNWTVYGDLTPTGGSAIIGIDIHDWQMNMTMAVVDTSALTGGYTYLQQSGYPNPWLAEISNTQHAPVGIYTVTVMSTSPSSPNYHTFNFYEIEVKSDDG